VQFASIVDTPFQTSTRLKEQALSVGCTKTKLTKPMMSDLVRMRLFSQTTRDVERIPQLILLIIISKGVFSKRVSGQQPTCLWWLSTTQLTMGGRKRTASYFQFGPWCPSPRICSTCRAYVKCTCPITCCQCNAWTQSWSVHISTSAHARSGWTSTISNSNMYIGALVKLLAIFLLNALFKDFLKQLGGTGWPKK